MNTYGLACGIDSGVSLGICALSYYFAYGYILASVVVFFVSSHKKVREGAISRRTVFLGALTIFFIAFAVRFPV